MQCLARLQQGFHLVELEVVTLAFATLNIIAYMLWWHKPQNVQVAIRIKAAGPLRSDYEGLSNPSHPTSVLAGPALGSTDGQQDHDCPLNENGLSKPRSLTHKDRLKKIIELIAAKTTTEPIASDEYNAGKEELEKRESLRHHEYAGSGPDRWHSSTTVLDDVECNSKTPFVQRKLQEDYAEFKGRKSRKWWEWAWFLFGRIPYRLMQSLVHPFSKMAGGDDLKINAQQVPMFYACSPVEDNVLAWSSLIAIVFGLIHFLAWSFTFPSQTERVLWRTTSFILVFEPAIFAVVNLDFMSKAMNRWGLFIVIAKLGLAFYIFARLAILVVAFISLRDLPESAFQEISWSAYIPHI